jgi:hypothetical protein
MTPRYQTTTSGSEACKLILSFLDLHLPLDVCLLLFLPLQAYEAVQPDAFPRSSPPDSIVQEVCSLGLPPESISAQPHDAA